MAEEKKKEEESALMKQEPGKIGLCQTWDALCPPPMNHGEHLGNKPRWLSERIQRSQVQASFPSCPVPPSDHRSISRGSAVSGTLLNFFNGYS